MTEGKQTTRKVKYPRPKWVIELLEKLRKETGKNLEVKFVNNSWHVHEYQQWWDPQSKKPKKISKYIGVLKKEEGFVPKKRKYRKRKQGNGKEAEVREVPLKYEGSYEYGASQLFEHYLRDTYDPLVEEFGEERAKQILAVSILWAVHGRLPLGRLSSVWEDTWLSRQWNDISLDSRKISQLLKYVGKRKAGRDALSGYLLMNSRSSYVLFDLTHLFSYSETVMDSEYGWNAEGRRDPQVRISVVHDGKSVFHMEPWQGTHREIAVLQTLQERLNEFIKAKKDIVFVGDRGIASYKLATEMDTKNLQFIMPLRKNFSVIDYTKKCPDVFEYQKRIIAYRDEEVDIEGHRMRLIMFYDSILEGNEKQMWLAKFNDGKISREELDQRLIRCGKIAILTNTDLPAQEVYTIYKNRAYVEECIKRFKDTLHLDGTYIRSDDAMAGYFFVATLSLRCHYMLMSKMQEVGILNRYSVEDVIWELRKVRKEPWVDGWHTRPLTRKQKTLLEKLSIHDALWIK